MKKELGAEQVAGIAAKLATQPYTPLPVEVAAAECFHVIAGGAWGGCRVDVQYTVLRSCVRQVLEEPFEATPRNVTSWSHHARSSNRSTPVSRLANRASISRFCRHRALICHLLVRILTRSKTKLDNVNYP